MRAHMYDPGSRFFQPFMLCDDRDLLNISAPSPLFPTWWIEVGESAVNISDAEAVSLLHWLSSQLGYQVVSPYDFSKVGGDADFASGQDKGFVGEEAP